MPKQNFEDLTWLEKVDLIRKLSLYPAITIMVLIRRRVGFRMLKPTWLIAMWIVMLVVPALFSSASRPFSSLMVIYAFAMLAAGLYQRWQRWKELCGNVHWYTYSPGISYLENLPLPPFLKSHYRLHRFVEPTALVLIGALIAVALSHALGLWIMFSAFFLHVYEQDLYERSVNKDLDTLDGMFMSELQSKLVKDFDPKKPTEQQQRNMEDTSGIPTGLAPDLHLRVQILQINYIQGQQSRPTGPDNLAPEIGDIQV